MSKDNLHTLERIDVKDRLPREDSYVLVWGHNKEYGIRWLDVFLFDGTKFVDEDAEEPDEFSHMVTHWAPLQSLNWNDGLPLGRGFVQ